MTTSDPIAGRDLGTLRAGVTGGVSVPGDHGYGEARRAWNLATDERPAVVVAAGLAAGVARAVRFAGSRGMRIAPQGTGHGAAPLEPLQDAMLLRTSRMRGVRIDPAARLLTGFSQRLGRYAERTLTRRGVEVRTKTHITGADGRQVTLSDGSVVPARTVVWSGGVAPLVPSTQPEPDTGRSGRVKVDEFLRIPGAQRAYVLGDAAGAEQDGHELPMVSAPAIQAGRYVARAIRADLAGRRPGPPFRYFDKGKMATIGRNAAVAQLRGGLQLTGFAGWLVWLFVHVWYLAGLRNRVMALVSWGWYYLRLDRSVRIILQTPPDPIVATLRSLDPGERHAAPAEIGRRTL